MATPEQTPDALHQYRWLLIGGVLLILLGGAAWTVTRTGPQMALASPKSASRSSLVLDALKEELFQLETDRIQSKVSAEDYDKAKAALDTALQRAMRKQS